MNKYMLKRLRFFSAVVVLMVLTLTARLAWLQIYNYDHYFARAETNRMRELPITAPRGEIFDRNGELLAGNRPGFTVSLLDLNKKDSPEVIAFLSELLEMEESEIRDRVWRQRFSSFAPIRLKNDVSAEVVAIIEEHRMSLPGAVIETQPVRHYPNDSLAAHVLGYVGAIGRDQLRRLAEQGIYYRVTDYIGQFGLESAWEHVLRGQDGTLRVETNRYGRRIRVLDKEDPIPGHNLVLTLDLRLQRAAEQALAEIIAEAREKGNDQVGKGAVVVLAPGSGEILAMASFPAYNPNTFSKDYPVLSTDPGNPLENKAIRGAYPIGSTVKMVAAVAGLEEGLINERTIITCTGSRFFLGESFARRCYNFTVHGPLNVVGALAKSCNLFFFELGLRLGIDRLTQYAVGFSFGRPTGLTDIGGELAGIFDSRESRRELGLQWNPGDLLTVSIGQGNTMVTPLQLANYGAMLANGGIHYRPYLVREVVTHSGEKVYQAEPEIINRLEFSDTTWETVRRGMEAVTSPGGTSASMRLLPVKVAGKTGTAEAGGKGTARKPHSLFVGYAPAEAPEIAFAVFIEHGEVGEYTAVPVVKKIINEYYGKQEAE